jgi:uncharacterized membrane protein YfcA
MQGAAVGAVTGLVGAGGGFLVVPALVLRGGLPMSAAVGTSLVVVAMNALAGFAGHLGTTPIDAPLATLVTGAAVVGSLLGSRFVHERDTLVRVGLRPSLALFPNLVAGQSAKILNGTADIRADGLQVFLREEALDTGQNLSPHVGGVLV